MPWLYLSDEAAEQLQEAMAWFLNQASPFTGRPVGERTPLTRRVAYVARAPSGGIPKRNGSTVHFRECDLYRVVYSDGDSTGTDEQDPDGRTVWVGNYSATGDVAEFAPIQVLREQIGGAVLANWEEC